MLVLLNFEVKNLSGEDIFGKKNRIFIFCFWADENWLMEGEGWIGVVGLELKIHF